MASRPLFFFTATNPPKNVAVYILKNENGVSKACGVLLASPINENIIRSVIKIIEEIKKRFGTDDFVLSLMSQYTPFGNIEKFPELNRKITAREYNAVVDEAVNLGIEKLFLQERKSSDTEYIPAWDF